MADRSFDTVDMATRGRIGGLMRAALHDGREMTAKARQTYRDSFLADPRIPADLPPAERQRRADALFKAHMARVSRAGVMARRRKAVSV